MKPLLVFVVLASLVLPCRAAIPDNDSFAARIPLFGASVTTMGSNVGATKEAGEPDPNFTGGRSVWWTWTAPSNGSLTITTAGSSFDTMLTVFTGNTLANLALAAFNDTELSTSTVTFNVTAGTAYQIAVDGTDNDYYPSNNATGNIVLQLTLGPTQPLPANDNFASRKLLSGPHVNNEQGSNVGATKEPREPFHADIIGEKTVWWTWTAPADGAVTLRARGTSTHGGALDTALGVYTGNSVSNLTFVAGNDEDEFGYESQVIFNVASNVTYQIAVDGFEGDEGSIRLDLDLNAALPVPTNDNFANRLTLTGSSVTTNATNVGASFEANEPMHLVTFGGKSIWWKWTAPASGSVMLTTTNSALDTILCVYTGTTLANLVFVAGNDDATETERTSLVYFNATSGTTYNIVVDGYDGASGPITLSLLRDDISDPIPANDTFANRITIAGTNTTVTGSNIGARLEAGEPLHRGYYGGCSVWWKWTSPGPGFVTIDTSGSVADTLLAVYTGSSLATLAEIASDNNSGSNWSSFVTFPTKSNVTYAIAVDGVDGDAGDLTLRVRFGQTSYALTLGTNPPGAGSVNYSPLPDQAGKYAPGSLVTLTATPALGNVFTGWSGDVSSTNNPLVLTINSTKAVTAEFFVPPSTKVWSGSHPQSGDWTNGQNWAGGIAPVAGDDLVFPAGAARLAGNTNNFPANSTFNFLTLGGANYVLRGNSLRLTNGLVCTNASGSNMIALNLLLGASQSFRVTNAATRLEISGDINLSNRTLTVAAPGDVVLSGVISGTGGIIKTNSGTLALSGTNPNGYTGATVVNEGVLELGKTGVAIPGALTIGDSVGGANADVVRLTASAQLASNTAVTLASSGQLDLNAFDTTVGSLMMTGGSVNTGAGTLGLNGNVTNNASSAIASIAGNLSLQGATRTFNVADGAASPDLMIFAVITNGGAAAGLTKLGNGTLQLAAANSFSGLTTVSAGTLAVAHAAALGATSQGTVVNTNASLLLNTVIVTAEPLTLTSATLQSDSGSNAWTGTITLANTNFFSVATNGTLNLPDNVTGAGALTKTGDGTLILSGAVSNSFGGATIVNQGTLVLSKSFGNAVSSSLIIGDGSGGADADVLRLDAEPQLPGTAAVTVNSSGLLNLNGFSTSAATLSGNGHVEFGGTNALLRIGGTISPSTFNGVISGGGQLAKVGPAAFTLAGNNTYTGATTVTFGQLFVNGQQPDSAVGLSANGILGGMGRVGNLSGSGTISPGTSPGVLTSGHVTFSSNTTFRVELNGNAAGSGYDQLNVSGTVTLAGTLNATLGFTPATNATFTIIDNNASDAVSGTFNGLPEGGYLVLTNGVFRISYAAGTGNDVVLTYVVPPRLTCPANVTTNTAPGSCSRTVAFSATVTAGSPAPTLTYQLGTNVITSPYTFAVGTNLVSATASNGVPTNAACSFLVIVRDNEPPAITCPSNMVVAAAEGGCPVAVNFSVQATDNCSVTNLTVTPASGSLFPPGTNLVTAVARDQSGNSNTCAFTVTVLPGPPALSITPGPEQVVLSWPDAYGCYALQYAPELTVSNLWTVFPGPFATNGGRVFATNALGASSRYFRLAH